MKNLDQDLLNEIVKRLVDALHPEKIYLFGSHAYGQPNDDSDVDIFIVINDTEQLPRMKAAEGYKALSGLLVPVEIKIATRSSFEKRSHWLSSIERVVSEKGKLLYESRV